MDSRPSSGAGATARATARRGLAGLRRAVAAVSDGLREVYVAPYRRTFARAQRDEEDLFMMLVVSEALGVPNPAAGTTLELLPEMLDRFHDWHLRMGMERSPFEENLRCC